MVTALRDHWKAHDNAYPQRFEFTQDASTRWMKPARR